MLKPKLLLHTCCAPCSAGVFEQLENDFQVSAFFYNPNIYPVEEQLKREQESRIFCDELDINFFELDSYLRENDNLSNLNKNIYIVETNKWFEKTKGYELEPEGGQRCLICYTIRLEKIAACAKDLGFDFFATTLTISPYKKAEIINPIGLDLAKKYNIKFYEADFKKKGGFQKSLEISKKHNLYRQNYCGCKFSIRT